MQNYKRENGFTLIELMIVVAIIGILSGVAMPMYSNYVSKSKFTSVIFQTVEYKMAVHLCLQHTSDPSKCSAGDQDIPANISTSTKYIASLTTLNGVISVTATNELSDHTYTLSPSYSGSRIIWTVGGTCVAADYC